MRYMFLFAFFLPFLTACMPKPMVAPVEQVQQQESKALPASIQTARVVKDSISLYQCEENRTVRVTQTEHNHKQLNVEFNQISHKLSLTVPKTSKRKFSNIRWIWTEEFDGTHTLRDKSGSLLAVNCLKK